MSALSFKKQFTPKIESGIKRQTIRRHRVKPIKKGETLYLYEAMRTKHCRRISTEVCSSVEAIIIKKNSVRLPDQHITEISALNEFAIADGFESWEDMKGWWLANHGEEAFPFEGILIKW